MYICYLTLTLNPNLTLKPNPKPNGLTKVVMHPTLLQPFYSGSTSNRNGPEWAEMDRNEPEWTEMEFQFQVFYNIKFI